MSLLLILLSCPGKDFPCPTPGNYFRPSVPPERTSSGSPFEEGGCPDGSQISPNSDYYLLACLVGSSPCAPEYLDCGEYGCSYCISYEELASWIESSCPGCAWQCSEGRGDELNTCYLACTVEQ